jgi:hypothetical protein
MARAQTSNMYLEIGGARSSVARLSSIVRLTPQSAVWLQSADKISTMELHSLPVISLPCSLRYDVFFAYIHRDLN